MKLNPNMEIELIFDDKELDLSTRQADIGIWMRRPKQLNYIQKKFIDINYLIYDENKELNLPTELVFEPSRFSEIDEVIISPGVKPSNSLLEQFYLIEKPVITDIDIFNNIYKEKIIGITGTNGKTTFVNLLAGFLNSQGSESIAVGNVGKSPLEIIDKKFD